MKRVFIVTFIQIDSYVSIIQIFRESAFSEFPCLLFDFQGLHSSLSYAKLTGA